MWSGLRFRSVLDAFRLCQGTMNIVLGQLVRRMFHGLGLDVVRYRGGTHEPLPQDLDAGSMETIRFVRARTMTSPERLFALIQAVRYVASSGVPGDIVECGVWRGGSMMAAARTLIECGDQTRTLYLFDTFDGMSAPTEKDVAIGGESADRLLANEKKSDPLSAWCLAPMEDVVSGMTTTQYLPERIRYVKGKVEDTIPEHAPEKIAILRLDTDWYESTRHELDHLYSRLSPGGVLIIDDYGHWAGCRQAVDEYFGKQKNAPLLVRVDYTGRIAVKPV